MWVMRVSNKDGHVCDITVPKVLEVYNSQGHGPVFVCEGHVKHYADIREACSAAEKFLLPQWNQPTVGSC
jgi:hypothetical protein